MLKQQTHNPMHALAVMALLSAASMAEAAPRPAADFNGDGYGDLAIGVPNENMRCAFASQALAAGAVQVVYGGSDRGQPTKSLLTGIANGVVGPDPAVWRNQLLARACLSGEGSGAHFGAALTYGDFNADGYDDLAVGVPNAALAGSVDVYTGSPSGLQRTLTLRKTQLRGVNLEPCVNVNNQGQETPAADEFGAALAAADVNGDGYADLAVASTCVSGVAGAVHIVRGSALGLTPSAPETRSYDLMSTLPRALAFGDFNGDGHHDLAIGAPIDFAWFTVHVARGHVLVQYGSDNGLLPPAHSFGSGSTGLSGGEPVANTDNFGAALAAADFNADGYADLAVGAPGKNDGAGIVHLLFGTASGLTTNASYSWRQNTVWDEAPEAGDRFGASLVAGRFATGARPQLAIGAPGEDGARGSVHIVTVMSGPDGRDHQSWTQDSPEVSDSSEAADRFGASLAITDLDGSGVSELAIGVPGEDRRAGAVNVLYAGPSGLTAAGNRMLKQAFDGLIDSAETGDGFGQL